MSASSAGRRAVTVPLAVGWHLLVLATAPLTLAAAAAVGLVTRSTRPVRSMALIVAYAGVELGALVQLSRLRRAARGRPAGDRLTEAQGHALVRWVVEAAYGAVRHVLGVEARLEDGSAAPEDVAACDGVIVLARHCGPGDTLLIAWLLVVHYRLRLRIVLKSLLRLVPMIDLAGDLLPFSFVGRKRGANGLGIARLASGLDAGQALLLFPEGGNFSRKRWAAAIGRLVASNERRRARLLRRNKHTLPPHLGGVSAALQAAPDAAVLLLAHSGLGDAGHERPWWRLPIRQQLVVRTLLVPPERVPRDQAAIREWLDEAWTRVDTWVDSYTALSALSDRPPSPRRD